MNPTMIVDNFGNKYWYLENKLHREDGPALEYPSGTKIWYLNGKIHRVDGPADEYPDGSKSWFLHDKHYATEEEYRLAD